VWFYRQPTFRHLYATVITCYDRCPYARQFTVGVGAEGRRWMDVGRSISYVFQDPNWVKKMLIGGVLSIIPVIGTLIVAGYWIRIASNVANGYELPLPEWNDFGGDFMRGLKVAVAVFIWVVPLIAVAVCGLVPAIVLGNSNGAAQSLAGVFSVAAFALIFVMSIALGFIAPIIVGRVAMQGSIS